MHDRSIKAVWPSREQPRCLGSALAVALQLLAEANPANGASALDLEGLPIPATYRPSRVLLVTTGPATQVLLLLHCIPVCLCTGGCLPACLPALTTGCVSLSQQAATKQHAKCFAAITPCMEELCLQGPGWVPLRSLDSRQGPADPQAAKNAYAFFQRLTQQAVANGTAVDVLAVGQAAVNVPLLGPLTQKTGGAIMAHHGACLQCRTDTEHCPVLVHRASLTVCSYKLRYCIHSVSTCLTSTCK